MFAVELQTCQMLLSRTRRTGRGVGERGPAVFREVRPYPSNKLLCKHIFQRKHRDQSPVSRPICVSTLRNVADNNFQLVRQALPARVSWEDSLTSFRGRMRRATAGLWRKTTRLGVHCYAPSPTSLRAHEAPQRAYVLPKCETKTLLVRGGLRGEGMPTSWLACGTEPTQGCGAPEHRLYKKN